MNALNLDEFFRKFHTEINITGEEPLPSFHPAFPSNSNSVKHHRLTAAQFTKVWSRYDVDGNGYIEGKELDAFLDELLLSKSRTGSQNSKTDGSDKSVAKIKAEIMTSIDENNDNRIDFKELGKLLPTEEKFLLLFQTKHLLKSSVEFMRIWQHFDRDDSGYIEADELKNFLQVLLGALDPSICLPEDKIVEYTDAIMSLFDINHDGKLQLSEMARLLPVEENLLRHPAFKLSNPVTSHDIDYLFKHYDQNLSGNIEKEELQGFLKDLLELIHEDYDEEDMNYFEKVILDNWDINRDGMINRNELKLIILQQSASTNDEASDKQRNPTVKKGILKKILRNL